MPGSFLGFAIADDADSVSARQESATGFIQSDEPLLESLKIIKKGKKGKEVNTSLIRSAQDIRDFLAWVSGPKHVPLPPLVRKILCLQRALLVASAAHTNTSSQLRTGVKQQLDAIDKILALDGVKNPSNAQACETQGSAFVPGSLKMSPPAAATSTAAKGNTHFHCDQSEVVKMLMDIKTHLGRIEAAAPPGSTARLAGLQQNLNVLSSIGRIDPGSRAIQIVNSLMEPNITEDRLKSLKTELRSVLDSTHILTQSQATLIRTGLESLTLRTQNNATSSLLRRLESIKVVPDIDLKPLLESLAAAGKQTDTALLSDAAATKPAELAPILEDLRGSNNSAIIDSLKTQAAQFDSRFTAIQTLLDSISERVENVTAIQSMIEKLRIDISEDAHAAELQKRIEELKAAVETIHIEPVDLEAINHALAQIQSLLAGSLPTLNEIAPKLDELRSSMAAAAATLESMPTSFDTITDRLSTQLSSTLQTLLEPIHTKLDAIQRTTSGMPELLTSTSSGVGSLQDQVSELHRKLDAMQGNVSYIREYVGGHGTRLDTMKTMIEGLTELVRVTHGPDGPQSRILSNINSALADLQATAHAASDSAAQAEIVRSLTELRDRVAAATATISEREGALAERDGTIRSLMDEKRDLEQRLRELQTSPNRNRGPVATLQAELTARKDREAALQSQITDLQSRISEMQTAASNTAVRHDGLLKTLQAEIVGLTEMRDELRGREATLRGSLNESRGTVEDLRRKLAECEAERAKAETDDVEKDAEIRDLRSQLTGLERIRELEATLTDIELKLKACTQARDALEQSHAAYVAQLKKNAGAKDLAIETMRAELEELRASATRDLAARNAEYGEKLTAEQKKQLSEYAESIADMEAAMKNAIDAERAKAVAAGQKQKETIARLNERIAELEASHDGDIEKSVAEKERRIVALTDRIRELQEQHAAKTNQNETDALKLQREEFAKERGELSSQLTQLRERLAEAETANAELQKRLDDCVTTAPSVPSAPSVPNSPEPFKKLDDSKYRVDLQGDHLIYNINARVWIGDGLRKIFQKDRLTAATNSVVPENARMAAFAILSEFLTRTPDIRVLERNNATLFSFPELKNIPITVDGAPATLGGNTPSDTIFASIGLLTYILERARAPEWRAPYTAAVPVAAPQRPPTPLVSDVRGSTSGRVVLAPRGTNATRKRYGRGSAAFGTVTPPSVTKSSRKTRKHRR